MNIRILYLRPARWLSMALAAFTFLGASLPAMADDGGDLGDLALGLAVPGLNFYVGGEQPRYYAPPPQVVYAPPPAAYVVPERPDWRRYRPRWRHEDEGRGDWRWHRGWDH